MLIINPQYQLQIVVLFFEKHINFKYRSQIPQQFQMRQQEEKKKNNFKCIEASHMLYDIQSTNYILLIQSS